MPESSNTTAPTRSPLSKRRQADRAAASAAVTDFMARLLPKNMVMRWSTTSSAGRSRSSVNTRTWGLRILAVTFQSMFRMSSPDR